MSTKQAFSTFTLSAPYRTAVSMLTASEKRGESVEEATRNLEQRCFEVGGTADEVEVILTMALLMGLSNHGVANHWFFDEPDSFEWLKHAAKGLDQTIFTQFVNQQDGLVKPTFIHFPGGNSECYLFAPIKYNDADQFYCFLARGTGKNACGIIQPGDDYQPENSTALTDAMQQVIGAAIAYKICFPDAFVPGIPISLRHPQHYKQTKKGCISIKLPQVAQRDHKHGGVSPHYRRSHFITLRHKRYGNNVGKIIFRKGCFINGHAETVTEI